MFNKSYLLPNFLLLGINLQKYVIGVPWTVAQNRGAGKEKSQNLKILKCGDGVDLSK